MAINFSRGSYYTICRKTGDYMRYIIVVIAALLFSSNSFAANELLINNAQMTLILDDGNQANVSSCSDFIALRNSGEKIKELPGLSDPDYREAKNSLFECWIKASAIKKGMIALNNPAPELISVLKHFPANAAYIISDEEARNVAEKYSGKSIWDYTPGLQINGDRAESAERASGYIISDYYSYADQHGNTLNVLALVGYTIPGTASDKVFWRIDDTSGNIWKIKKLDENSDM